MSDNKLSRERNDTLISVVVGALLGAFLTFLTTYGYDFLKENKARDELVQMLYYDIKNQVKQNNVYLSQAYTDNDFKKLGDIYTSEGCFDLKVFDAYLNEIHLLPPEEANAIILFYRGLAIVNSTSNEMKDRVNYLPAQRIKMAIDMKNQEVEISKTGEWIIKGFQHDDKGHVLED